MKPSTAFLFCLFLLWTKGHSLAPDARIIGGNTAQTGQFPFMVAINVQTADSTFFCGGALVSTKWVLTSAQCTYRAATLTLRLGSTRLDDGVTVASTQAVPHPEFNPSTLENDIGLIRLELPIDFSDYIKPIRIASVALPDSSAGIALGWGQTSDDNPDLPAELNYVDLSVTSNNECRLFYGNQIADTMVCAEGSHNEGSCVGDSGGPLVVSLIGGQFLEHVGVSSFYSGNGCESTDPSGYTRTFSYVDWIRNVTLED